MIALNIKKDLATKGTVVAQYVPVIVYIVVVVDIPAGCALIEYPSAACGFTSLRTGTMGRPLRGHDSSTSKEIKNRYDPKRLG